MWEELDGAVEKLRDTKAGWVTRRDAVELLGKVTLKSLDALQAASDEMDVDVRRSVDDMLGRIDDMTDLFCENLRRYRVGKPLVNFVDKHLGFPEPSAILGAAAITRTDPTAPATATRTPRSSPRSAPARWAAPTAVS